MPITLRFNKWRLIIGVLLVTALATVWWGRVMALETAAAEKPTSGGTANRADEPLGIAAFLNLTDPRRAVFRTNLAEIEDHWDDRYTPMLLEVAQLAGWQDRSRFSFIAQLVERKTGIKARSDLDPYFQSVWEKDYDPHPGYARFKAELYRRIDPRFEAYFDDHTDDALIRLDEVRWGGVRRDGIPPLKNPKMIPADAADYLDDDNTVFGLEVNGDARAYPKRILAWHEMFKDTVGGVSVNGVYCTLCGSMILYQTEHGGTHYELGTSGFLYRSNKLMYDHTTESMWSTIKGEPVIGPLVGRGIKLEPLSVVTTTWGQWKRDHPETTVLSLDTGHRRDYREGAAYREYFATDRLMFTVPTLDTRLKNKDEVLALRFGDEETEPAAIAAAFLEDKPIYQAEHGGVSYVILTDPAGANRVYESDGVTFTGYDGAGEAMDERGRTWAVTESSLTTDGAGSDEAEKSRVELLRLPAHRAFWFGWHAAHPDTTLVQ